MIEISPVTVTHSVTDRAIRNLPFRVVAGESFLGECDLVCGPNTPETHQGSTALDVSTALNASTALDSVRNTGHEKAGRVEKSRAWQSSRGRKLRVLLVRQHKDDFSVVLLVIAVIVIVFRDHDGLTEIDAPCREQRFSLPIRQQQRSEIIIDPRVNDHLCEGIILVRKVSYRHVGVGGG